MEASLISIVIPVYNAAQYLSNCVKSVLCQTYSNIEIIIINDGSTDDSGKIADQLAEEDKRVRVFHKANSGVSDSRNHGLSYANGEWVTFVDSDDMLSEEYLAQLLAEARSDTDFCLCDFEMITENGVAVYKTFQPGDSAERTLYNMFMCGWIFSIGILFRRSFLETHKLLFPKHINYTEDVWFDVRAIFHAKSIRKVSKPLYRYNCINSGSITHNSNNEIAEEVRLESIKESIEFLLNNHSFEQCKKACYWRVLVWKSWMVFDPRHYADFNAKIPEANRFIWSCPHLSSKMKVALWFVSVKMYLPAKFLAILYRKL